MRTVESLSAELNRKLSHILVFSNPSVYSWLKTVEKKTGISYNYLTKILVK